MLALLADTRQDQHHDGHHVREHFDDLSLGGRDVGNDVRHNIASTEQDRAQDAEGRLPEDEDDESDCQPTECLDGSGIFPASLDVIHDIVEATETCDYATRKDGHVLIANNVDARGISGSGALSHGAQVKSHAGLVQHDGTDDGHRNGKIHENAMAQHHAAEVTQLLRKGERGGNQLTRGIEMGTVHKGHDEVGRADAENGDGKTRNVLVTTQGYSQDSIHRAKCRRKRRRAGERDENQQDPGCVFRGGESAHVKRNAEATARATHTHDAGNTQVEVSRFFGNDLTDTSVQKDNGNGDCRYKKRYHAFVSPFVPSISVVLVLALRKTTR